LRKASRCVDILLMKDMHGDVFDRNRYWNASNPRRSLTINTTSRAGNLSKSVVQCARLELGSTYWTIYIDGPGIPPRPAQVSIGSSAPQALGRARLPTRSLTTSSLQEKSGRESFLGAPSSAHDNLRRRNSLNASYVPSLISWLSSANPLRTLCNLMPSIGTQRLRSKSFLSSPGRHQRRFGSRIRRHHRRTSLSSMLSMR
jgi:hypothetical protein